MRENRAGKHARAVVVVLAAKWTEHVVVGAILVVVLEKIVGLRRPFDELPLFEFIQLVTDIVRIDRMRDEQKQDVVKRVVCREQPDDDRRRQQEYRNSVHSHSFELPKQRSRATDILTVPQTRSLSEVPSLVDAAVACYCQIRGNDKRAST